MDTSNSITTALPTPTSALRVSVQCSSRTRQSGLMLLGDLRPEEKANLWVGWVPQEEGYVILHGPKLTKAGRLTAATLRRLRGLTHFVIPSDD